MAVNHTNEKADAKTSRGNYFKEDSTWGGARAYLRSRFVKPGSRDDAYQPQPIVFQCRCYHEFYNTFHDNWNNKEARVLEFGGGPSIYQHMSAPPYVAEVVHTDYTDGCRKEVQMWIDGTPDAHDWMPFFEYFVNDLEGKQGSALAAERQEELRKRMSVAHCDVRTDPPIDAKLGKFDIISSCYCLESVCVSKEEVLETLRKLSKLMKTGGYIVLLVSIEMNWYTCEVYGEKCGHLYLTCKELADLLQKAGFTIEMERYYPTRREDPELALNDGKGKDFIVARKCEVKVNGFS